jgi:predicted Ser/Thr protein kinase
MTLKIVQTINQSIVDYVAKAIEEYEKGREGYIDNYERASMYKPLSSYFTKQIGGGCNGEVFEYEGYAVKYFSGAEQYCNDGKMLEALNGSPYFPTVYAHDKDFMIMERIIGYSLDDYCVEYDKLKNKLQVSPAFKYHLEKAFEHADKRGVELTDLKKSNIMINESGLPVIVDAGTFYLKGEFPPFNIGGKSYCLGWCKEFMEQYCKFELAV